MLPDDASLVEREEDRKLSLEFLPAEKGRPVRPHQGAPGHLHRDARTASGSSLEFECLRPESLGIPGPRAECSLEIAGRGTIQEAVRMVDPDETLRQERLNAVRRSLRGKCGKVSARDGEVGLAAGPRGGSPGFFRLRSRRGRRPKPRPEPVEQTGRPNRRRRSGDLSGRGDEAVSLGLGGETSRDFGETSRGFHRDSHRLFLAPSCFLGNARCLGLRNFSSFLAHPPRFGLRNACFLCSLSGLGLSRHACQLRGPACGIFPFDPARLRLRGQTGLGFSDPSRICGRDPGRLLFPLARFIHNASRFGQRRDACFLSGLSGFCLRNPSSFIGEPTSFSLRFLPGRGDEAVSLGLGGETSLDFGKTNRGRSSDSRRLFLAPSCFLGKTRCLGLRNFSSLLAHPPRFGQRRNACFLSGPSGLGLGLGRHTCQFCGPACGIFLGDPARFRLRGQTCLCFSGASRVCGRDPGRLFPLARLIDNASRFGRRNPSSLIGEPTGFRFRFLPGLVSEVVSLGLSGETSLDFGKTNRGRSRDPRRLFLPIAYFLGKATVLPFRRHASRLPRGNPCFLGPGPFRCLALPSHLFREVPEDASNVKPLHRIEGKDLTRNRRAHPAHEDVEVAADTGRALLTGLKKKPARPLEPAAEETQPHHERLVKLLETKAKLTSEEGPDFDLGPQQAGVFGEQARGPLNRPPL